jgi:quinol-cytochrome oxidoreductase complex cytochrome b subunit
MLLGIGYTLQLFFGIINLCHPDNNVEVNGLVTPQHIVPEWYFLSFYAVLKVIPSKSVGLIIFTTAVLILLLLCELSLISSISRLTSYLNINTNLIITILNINSLSELWIGAQIPLEMFLSI